LDKFFIYYGIIILNLPRDDHLKAMFYMSFRYECYLPPFAGIILNQVDQILKI